MKTISEIAYLEGRARIAREAALDAHDVCARNAHRGLADAYDQVVNGLLGTLADSPARLRQSR